MTDLSTLRFFKTPAHSCSYLENREATTLFVDPKAPVSAALYDELSQLGFRRSGEYLYRPHCEHCRACIPLRIPVTRFEPRRRHRRLLKRTEHIEMRVEPARFTPAIYQLYARYINHRHIDGDMYPPSEEQFASFLMSDWSDTRFLSFYDEGRLFAVAVTDILSDGLSAVYTFFEPDYQHLSPGTLAILRQLAYCQVRGLPHLYLGYWVKDCRKMDYKRDFSPVEALSNNRWQSLD